METWGRKGFLGELGKVQKAGSTPDHVSPNFKGSSSMTTAPTDRKRGSEDGKAWAARADALAAWTIERLVVRNDVWGGYVRAEDRGKEFTRKDGTKYVLGSTWTR